MAKKVKTWLTDDKEAEAGREVDADQTVEFGLDGTNYEIDLSAKNAMKLRNDIEQWISCARKVGHKARVTRPTRPAVDGMGSDGMDTEQRKACRAWLRNNGHPDLPDRGRIPAALMAEFHARPEVA